MNIGLNFFNLIACAYMHVHLHVCTRNEVCVSVYIFNMCAYVLRPLDIMPAHALLTHSYLYNQPKALRASLNCYIVANNRL